MHRFIKIALVFVVIGCGRENYHGDQESLSSTALSSSIFGANLIFDCRAGSGVNYDCHFRETELARVQPYESVFTVSHTFICAGQPVNLGFVSDSHRFSVPYNSGTSSTFITGFGPVSVKNLESDLFNAALFSTDCRFVINSIDVSPSERTKNEWRARKADLIAQIADATDARNKISELVSLKEGFAVITKITDARSLDMSRNFALRDEFDAIGTCSGSPEADCDFFSKIMFSTSIEFTMAEKQAVRALEDFLTLLPQRSACSNSDSTTCATMVLEQSLNAEDLAALRSVKEKSSRAADASESYQHFSYKVLALTRDLEALKVISEIKPITGRIKHTNVQPPLQVNGYHTGVMSEDSCWSICLQDSICTAIVYHKPVSGCYIKVGFIPSIPEWQHGEPEVDTIIPIR